MLVRSAVYMVLVSSAVYMVFLINPVYMVFLINPVYMVQSCVYCMVLESPIRDHFIMLGRVKCTLMDHSMHTKRDTHLSWVVRSLRYSTLYET